MVPSVEYIITVLSVMRCGEAFMPIDPSWPDEKISMVVSSSKVDFVIGPSYSADGKRHHQPDKARELVEYIRCPFLYVSMKDNLPDHLNPSNVPYPCENERSQQFCYVMHTSGSTGKPKGVCGTELGKPTIRFYLWCHCQHLFANIKPRKLGFVVPDLFYQVR